jgi:DNA relaxase NicK
MQQSAMFAALDERENPPVLTGGLGLSGGVVEGWGAHVDWFTGTCEDGRGQARFPDEAQLMAMIDAYGTERMDRWRMRDYTGYSVGKVAWGERLTGSIRQITSHQADLYVRSVDNLQGQMNCTRLDITCDIRLATYGRSFVSSIAMERSELSGVERLGRPLLMRSFGNGDTFYVGSPASAKRLRVYDKYAESGYDERYKNTVRYELQLRAPHSDVFFSTIGGDKDGKWTILATVKSHCERICCYMPCVDCSAMPVTLRVPEVERTVDKQLEWLRAQVSPTVRRLIAAGHKDKVLAALGLTDCE